jgi:hypothetical protein
MKKSYLMKLAGGLSVLLIISGCACHDVRRSQRLVTVDVNPGQANKGYAEFYSVSADYPFPVYLVDAQGKELLLANMGLKHGERYCYGWHGAQVGERVRVAVPAGTHTFLVDNGPAVHVPVLADKLTPVEVDYTLLDEVTRYIVYRADVRPAAPGPFVQETETKPKK